MIYKKTKFNLWFLTRHVLVIFFLFFPVNVLSEQISVFLPNKISANADYRVGDTGKPAIMVLHGFMATHNLNIIQIIANELESNGYTVLAPTLSLNINNRKSSADCEAVHTHTMQTDIEEIHWWIKWLESKGHQRIFTIGHSTGSLHLAAALSDNPPHSC